MYVGSKFPIDVLGDTVAIGVETTQTDSILFAETN
jgi:hypothetical protein